MHSFRNAIILGYAHELYRVDLPRTFSGLTYRELVLFLFTNIQVIPIAMITVSDLVLAVYDES